MAKRLTPEEKAARDLQRKLDREATRKTKIAERQAAWEAQRRAERDAFEASLDDHSRAAIASVLVPIRQEQAPYRPEGEMRDVYESEFIGSLASQLKTWGKLSPNQLASVVKQYDRKLEAAALVEKVGALTTGDDIKALCKVTAIEMRGNGFGMFWKIRLSGHNGRQFHINTTAQRILSVASEAKEEDIPVNVQGKAGWVSPDNRVVVLDKKGLYFQCL